jgi:hypothetical protein
MRGWIRIILPLAAVALWSASLVSIGHAALPPCAPGTTNPLYCEVPAPKVVVASLSPSCRSGSKAVHIRANISAQGGLARVRITLDGRTIKRQKSGKVRLTISVRKLDPGVHTVKIIATDRAGKRTTRTLHFRVCKLKISPAFTG